MERPPLSHQGFKSYSLSSFSGFESQTANSQKKPTEDLENSSNTQRRRKAAVFSNTVMQPRVLPRDKQPHADPCPQSSSFCSTHN